MSELYYPSPYHFYGEPFVARIEGEDYKRCEEASKNMWCNSKPGKYGAGLANTNQDPYKVSRVGKLGEMAFAKLFRLGIDLSYKKGGDETDCIIDGKKIDIKTALRNYNTGLIYKTNEWGKEVPLKSDIYVFAHLKEEDRESKIALITLVGYCYKAQVLNAKVAKGRKRGSKHYNYEIPYLHLKPIYELQSELNINGQLNA